MLRQRGSAPSRGRGPSLARGLASCAVTALVTVVAVVAPGAGVASGLGACGHVGGRELFAADVAPLLERQCLGAPCHGVAPGAEARGEVVNWSQFHVRTTSDGRIADMDAAYSVAKARINTVERAELSTLLRKPLAQGAGGLLHKGGVSFARRDDPDYQRILAWIAAESEGGEGGSHLSPNERRFASDVLPALATRQCMNGPCHGSVAPFTAFEPPMELDGALVFSTEAVRKNYHAARMHLFLAGDPALSRLVRKALPLDRGGILHRGGNGIFFAPSGPDPGSDPTVRAIVGWAGAEREEALGTRGPPGLRGVVLVRGPVAPAPAFEHDAFTPGTDLWVLEPPVPGGTLRSLTAAAHPEGPADVRDPAVSHDATRVVFAMRRSVEDAHNLYEIRVDGTGLVQLTHDLGRLPRGGRAANVQPTYGPDGRVYFVSTRAGHLADTGALDTEIWAVSPRDGALERVTHDPSPEATPAFIGTGKSYGTLSFTVLRGLGGRSKGVVFRGPLDRNKKYHGDPELHVHHGITPAAELVYGARAMPDGRFAAALFDRASVWRGGRLAVFDRQLGPEIAGGHEASSSEPGYRAAFTVLDERAATSGRSPGGVYRHPVPLPDGRILVSYADGPLDLGATAPSPSLSLVALTLSEDPRTGRPAIAKREVLATDPGGAMYDGEPIAPRPLEDDPTHEPAWDPSRETGTLSYRHVETLEAIMSYLEPRGAKPLRADLVYARLVEAVPTTPDDLAQGPVSLGAHGRARILAEVPLAGGSLHLEVPAGRPFRVQTLDAARMAVGAQHDRWIDVAPGQVFPGGVSPELYPTLCAGCHGALSGQASSVGGVVPDVVTQASVTLATHANMDPRRPLPPTKVGDAPIAVDFRRDVRPLLARSCAGCHGGATPAGGLDLAARTTARFDTAYEALLAPGVGSGNGKRYVDEPGSSAFTSHLTERIYGRELGAPRAGVGAACTGSPALSDSERLVFVRWIDLGATYRGSP
ncbi:MAG: hypothetical protein IPF92_16725 [Myxococcales bacterium]|nr:hypothetical protein [Myxococcales bacterium]HQY60139.1 hypothetical protein [Polyangiaceae bacterium]